MLEHREFSLEKACQSNNFFTNLEDIIETHPNEAARLFGRSIVSSLGEGSEKTLEHLELLTKENPNIPLLHQRIAETCIDSEKYKKAVLHLEKILELDNQNLTARVWLCLVHYLLGNTKKAKETFQPLKKSVYRMRVNTKNWWDE